MFGIVLDEARIAWRAFNPSIPCVFTSEYEHGNEHEPDCDFARKCRNSGWDSKFVRRRINVRTGSIRVLDEKHFESVEFRRKGSRVEEEALWVINVFMVWTMNDREKLQYSIDVDKKKEDAEKEWLEFVNLFPIT